MVWIPLLGPLLIPVLFSDVVHLIALTGLLGRLSLVDYFLGCLVDLGLVLVLLAWWESRSVVLVVVSLFR